MKDTLDCAFVENTNKIMLACSSDGVLELEPMNAYNRLLLHRLSEIFGYFSFKFFLFAR